MHPILFWIGGVPVGAYGMAVLAGLGAGLLLVPRSARWADLDRSLALRGMLVGFASGALGCRLANVFLRLPEVVERPELGLWLLQQAGVWYGAIAGGVVAALALRREGVSFATWMDVAAVPAVVGGGIGRVGCLMSGCCFGTPTSVPWAITYENALAHRLHPDLPWAPVHPVPLYELGAALAIALALDRVASRRPPRGTVALCWLLLYGLARAGLEAFRGDAIRGFVWPGVSTSSAVGLLSAMAAASVLALRLRRSFA